MADATGVAVIGAGNIGIAVAFYLLTRHGVRDIVLIDPGDPMALTSAQSGENYRNWWPHPVMTAFTDHATSLLEEISRATDDRIRMTRRGYVLATRQDRPEELIADLHRGYGSDAAARIRLHDRAHPPAYRPATEAAWQAAPDGVDVLLDPALIRATFPGFAPDIRTVLHIRRAGDISGQQLGQLMLETLRAAGVTLRRAAVTGSTAGDRFQLALRGPDGPAALNADRIVNAAGPFFTQVGAMLGETLPVSCVYQQKIAFEDRDGAIPRNLPFSIDLDGQELPWTPEERDTLASDPETAALLRPMPGGVHRRPEGGDGGTWIKLGWAYNTVASDPAAAPPVDPDFPDIVLRAASRLTPALGTYIGRLPRGARHYGGFYAMTPENWPLVGPMRTPGAFMAGALSGFGTMGATAAGALCAGWMAGTEQPAYARHLTGERYADPALMDTIRASAGKGVL